jgi:hypothetical protein
MKKTLLYFLARVKKKQHARFAGGKPFGKAAHRFPRYLSCLPLLAELL